MNSTVSAMYYYITILRMGFVSNMCPYTEVQKCDKYILTIFQSNNLCWLSPRRQVSNIIYNIRNEETALKWSK